LTASQVIAKSGLQQREKELEAVLGSLRSYPDDHIIALGGDLATKVRWLLDIWDVSLGKSGLILLIGESFLDRILTTRPTGSRNRIARTAYLCLSPLQFFIIGLEELIDEAFRDTVTRCGMCCERIVNELLRETMAFEMLEPNVKFVDKVGFLQNALSERGYRPSQNLCSSMLTVYDIRNQRGPHDVPSADEVEAKFCASSFPWIYSKYLEVLQILGYDLLENADRLVELCNSIVTVRTTLAIKPGHLAFNPREAIEILLYKNGFFSDQRSFAEIMLELKKLGYNYPKPSVANALEGLTREFLSRSGKPGAFRYHQKIPQTEYYKRTT